MSVESNQFVTTVYEEERGNRVDVLTPDLLESMELKGYFEPIYSCRN